MAVNPQNTWLSSITVAELKKIWEPAAQGKITHWNQVVPTGRTRRSSCIGAGSDSGTFDYFTEAIVGKAKSSRGDYTASEDDNVLVQGIDGNKYALGYIPYAYFAENEAKLKAVAIEGEQRHGGKCPARDRADGTYNPLSRPLFIYVSKKGWRSRRSRSSSSSTDQGRRLANEVKYVAAAGEGLRKAMERFAEMRRAPDSAACRRSACRSRKSSSASSEVTPRGSPPQLSETGRSALLHSPF